MLYHSKHDALLEDYMERFQSDEEEQAIKVGSLSGCMTAHREEPA